MTEVVRIYLFSPILFTFLHQRPQRLAEHFLRRSFPVTFVEPSGFREYLAGRRRGLSRLFGRSVKYHLGLHAVPAFRRGSDAPTSGAPTLDIASLPFVIPSNLVNSKRLEQLNAQVFRAAILNDILMRRSPGERSVIVAETPFFGSVLREGDADAIYYDCIDDLSLYAGRASTDRFQEYERRLVAMSKAVFVTSSALEREIRQYAESGRVVRVPNGVEASWLQSRVVNPAEQGILQEVRTPIAGYVGSMREWFDEALVLEAARAMPGVTFVLVGPVEDPSRLEGLKGQRNVVFTGRIAHEDVPRYVARFDVALIPFRAGRVAERTDPVKLYEYFALGKPVVATPMSELEQFTPGRLVYLGEKESGFVEALRAGMDDHDEARRLARMQVARENTWERAASTMLTTILETIDA